MSLEAGMNHAARKIEILEGDVSDMVRVRFAPSPTGFIHIGSLRTALYNFLFARKNNGVFVLRIEDTDQKRYVESAVENLIETLKWAGLDYDEGPGKTGDFGPYIQSQRSEIYRKYASELVEKGLAYPCFCTPERLEEMRRMQDRTKLPPMYDRICRGLPPGEIRMRMERGEPHTIRLLVPQERTIVVDDIIRGKVSFAGNTIDDQVLLKSDGFPTYHLTNVVDDHLMKITHVIRGEEWLISTPKHILLYEYLGWEPPVFAHLPLLLNPDRSKLSKRQGDVAVEDYRRKGYPSEALINFVALLGWNPGTEQEIFTMEELIAQFSLERVNKAGAIFDLNKLLWISTQHLRRKSDEELAAALRDYIESLGEKGFTTDYLLRVVRLMKERVNFIHEFRTFSDYFFEDPQKFDAEGIKKHWKGNAPALVAELKERLLALQEFSAPVLEQVLRNLATERQISAGKIIHPVRLLVSGKTQGPGLFDLMETLGKEKCLSRIEYGLKHLKTSDKVVSDDASSLISQAARTFFKIRD